MDTVPKVSSPSAVLVEVAEALNKLRDLGERIDIRFGSVMTDHGYVLCGEDGRWSAKLKVGEPPAWWAHHSRNTPDDD